MTTIKNAMTVAAAAAILAPAALDAQVRMTVPPQAEPIAIQGATIHTVTNGVIENGTIIFNDGVITAIGADLDIPAGTRVVDGRWASVRSARSTSRTTSTNSATSTRTYGPTSL
jgi:hypothetical protein